MWDSISGSFWCSLGGPWGAQKTIHRYKIKKMTFLFLMHFLILLIIDFVEILASILEGFRESFGSPKGYQNRKSKKYENRYHSHTECKVLLFGEAETLNKSFIF